MRYALYNLGNPRETFATRFTLPLWNYIVPPPSEGDSPYVFELDFSVPPLSDFLIDCPLAVGDVLELTILRRRVQLQAANIRVLRTAGALLAPFTGSGVPFDTIDTGALSRGTYLPFGGTLETTTTPAPFVVDWPDVFAFQILSDPATLGTLQLEVQLVTYSGFAVDTLSNATLYKEASNA